MSTDDRSNSVHQKWAVFSFSVICRLLVSPPPHGQLASEIRQLAATTWDHPITGEPTSFAFSTIERWYYVAAKAGTDPVAALRRKLRSDAGSARKIHVKLDKAIRKQHKAHRSWSYRLHHDNLVALADEKTEVGPVPSYDTVLRYMKSQGLYKTRSFPDTEGGRRAQERLEQREVRSYEMTHVGGLWHLDFHPGSRKVLVPSGEWVAPVLFGVLDDHSRLACHAQWYLVENAENTTHGLCQAFQKRGLPRAVMSDNGQAERAIEVASGLDRLGIDHELTLAYSPYQNGKKETWWELIEERLLPMLENKKDLTLALLNLVTQVWTEGDYNAKVHSETAETPIARFVNAPSVLRDCCSSEELRQRFTREVTRKQRRSDGTISINGRRFEVSSHYRHLQEVTVRFAEWDLTHLYLVDPERDLVLCRLFPQDKAANADGRRRTLPSPATEAPAGEDETVDELAPVLRKLLREHAATGLPPGYIPKDDFHDPSDPEACNKET